MSTHVIMTNFLVIKEICYERGSAGNLGGRNRDPLRIRRWSHQKETIMNTELIKLNDLLNEAWSALDAASNIAHREGYSGIQRRLTTMTTNIYLLQNEIEEKEFGDD